MPCVCCSVGPPYAWHCAPLGSAQRRFYAKAVNCCAEVRLILDSGPDEGPDAGRSCPPVGPCRGYEGNCGDLAMQFWDMPVLPNYPYGLQDWYCAAFPNDESTRDSFLVGLISSAFSLHRRVFVSARLSRLLY